MVTIKHFYVTKWLFATDKRFIYRLYGVFVVKQALNVTNSAGLGKVPYSQYYGCGQQAFMFPASGY